MGAQAGVGVGGLVWRLRGWVSVMGMCQGGSKDTGERVGWRAEEWVLGWEGRCQECEDLRLEGWRGWESMLVCVHGWVRTYLPRAKWHHCHPHPSAS